ncbi:hypothetical protein ACQPYE_05585 [Actinosynnema sp. CA-299493]
MLVVAAFSVLTVGAGMATAAGPAVVAAGPTEVYSRITSADIADPGAVLPTGGDEMGTLQTVEGAIDWFRNRQGSTEYDGYCERAVRLAWNRSTHHASAIAHWNSNDGGRHTGTNPPRGAFVFWNISSYGHVGLSDGNGGVWATSVGGRIGHVSRTYFANYLGWKYGNSN